MPKIGSQVHARRFVAKTALVTVGSSGIGQAIALRFAREGAAVAINYHHDERPAEETRSLAGEQLESCVNEVRACGVGAMWAASMGWAGG